MLRRPSDRKTLPLTKQLKIINPSPNSLFFRKRYFIFGHSKKISVYKRLFFLNDHKPLSKEGVNPKKSGAANNASTPLPYPDVMLYSGIVFLLRTRVPKATYTLRGIVLCMTGSAEFGSVEFCPPEA
jgi:hypothetical protein